MNGTVRGGSPGARAVRTGYRGRRPLRWSRRCCGPAIAIPTGARANGGRGYSGRHRPRGGRVATRSISCSRGPGKCGSPGGAGACWPPHLRVLTAHHVVWTVDFKGEFRTGDGRLCYPFTFRDGYSRFVLRCTALPSVRGEHTPPELRRAFAAYGLPERIRSDNGPPFGSPTSLARLSRLALVASARRVAGAHHAGAAAAKRRARAVSSGAETGDGVSARGEPSRAATAISDVRHGVQRRAAARSVGPDAAGDPATRRRRGRCPAGSRGRALPQPGTCDAFCAGARSSGAAVRCFSRTC